MTGIINARIRTITITSENIRLNFLLFITSFPAFFEALLQRCITHIICGLFGRKDFIMPVILGLLIIIVVLIAYEKRKSEKQQKKDSDHFWEREREANCTRRKDISALSYLTIPFDTLPFSATPESEEFAEIEQRLRTLSGERILNLSGKTNTELKLAYGTANLPALSQYDQNYIVLIRALSRWAVLLHNCGKDSDAVTVLEYAVQIGSDIRNDFLLLARLYADKQDLASLDSLIAHTETLTTLTKSSLLEALKEIRRKCSSSPVTDLFV